LIDVTLRRIVVGGLLVLFRLLCFEIIVDGVNQMNR